MNALLWRIWKMTMKWKKMKEMENTCRIVWPGTMEIAADCRLDSICVTLPFFFYFDGRASRGVARRREASWASSSLRPRFLCDAQPATAHGRAFSSDDWWLYVYISTSNRSQLILAANFAHPFYFNSSQSKLIPFVTTTWKDRKCPI